MAITFFKTLPQSTFSVKDKIFVSDLAGLYFVYLPAVGNKGKAFCVT